MNCWQDQVSSRISPGKRRWQSKRVLPQKLVSQNWKSSGEKTPSVPKKFGASFLYLVRPLIAQHHGNDLLKMFVGRVQLYEAVRHRANDHNIVKSRLWVNRVTDPRNEMAESFELSVSDFLFVEIDKMYWRSIRLHQWPFQKTNAAPFGVEPNVERR